MFRVAQCYCNPYYPLMVIKEKANAIKTGEGKKMNYWRCEQKVMDTETAPAWSFCYVDCYGQATVSVDDSDYSNNEVVVSSPRPSFDLIGGTTVAVVEAATERQAQNAFRAAFPYQRWCFDRSQVCGACFDEVSRVERVSS